jgi:Zinc dependent phospholipase C
VAFWLLVLFGAQPASSYSVLTHEAIVDSTWDSAIKPLLLKRFPDSTHDELRTAHAYAYGGSIIQDLGYYPFGSKFYSDLVHYVRSGDFIANLIRESQDINEYAFALGALSHYAADNNGHRLATNVTVPVLYPTLARKFGDVVTYADDPASHMKTEFGFDVFQAAKHRYAPPAFKDFIGFEVSKPVLERAFEDTYGLKIETVFLKFDFAIGSYRRAVGSVLPALTKVAWQLRGSDIRKEAPGITRKEFLYNLSRSSYEKNWGRQYHRAGFGTTVLATFIRVVPKVGPLKALSFKKMTPKAEELYMASFNATIDQYRELLGEVGAGRLVLPNSNIDTGDPSAASKYRLADDAYAKLLHKLAEPSATVPADLRENVLAFYQNLDLPIATKRNPKEWASLLEDLNHLKSATADAGKPPASSPIASKETGK